MSVSVYPDDVQIHLGLGGIYRNVAISEEHLSLSLPLHESQGTQARDISPRRLHGTWHGIPTTRAVSFDIPEGALGPEFTGDEYVEVPDDLTDSGPNLSFAAGSIDVTFMMNTSHNSGTARCIVGKQVGDETGAGWHVALVNGGIRFAVYLSGSPSLLFSFERGGSAYASRVGTDGPVAYWRLNEISGTSAADDTGNAHTGTYVGSPTFSVAGPLADGSAAVGFDGVNDYMTAPDHAALDITTNLSIEAWIYGTAFNHAGGGNFPRIVAKGGVLAGYQVMIEQSTGTLRVELAGLSDLIVNSTATFSTATWYHVVVTYDGSNIRIYINGTLDSAHPATGSITANSASIDWGRRGDGARFWQGRLSNCAVYNTVLSGTTVAAHYALRTATSAVADGEDHRVHCCYEPDQSRARIFIDGVQSGAAVTGVTTEPGYTASDLRVGMFADGVEGDGSGFIGRLAYINMSRDGDPTLSTRLEATTVWHDVTDDVLISQLPISWSRGIQGTGIEDNVAGPGTLQFALDNGETNTAGLIGYYTVGHANCRDGFTKGIPVKLTVVYGTDEYVKFRGFIKSANATPGENGELYTHVTCVDWMHVAMRAFTSTLPIQLDATSGVLFGVVVDTAERPPVALEVHAGSEIFPTAFDSSQGENDSPMGEFVRIMSSERGVVYVKGDGTVVAEGRALRQTVTENAAMFTFQHDLQPVMDAERIVNKVRGTFYPRDFGDTDTDVLASLPTENAEHLIPPGGSVDLEGPYRDPDQTLSRIGGTDTQPVTATTDYTMNASPDGTGSDLTANFTVEAVAGGNLVNWHVTNTSDTVSGYITKLQQRGRFIRYDEAQPVIEAHDESIRENGERPIRIDLPYVASLSAAQGIARMIVNLFATLDRPVPVSASFMANYDDQTFRDVMARDIGDRVGFEEPVNVIDDDDGRVGYFIQSEEGTIEPGGIITVNWGLSLPLPTGAWVLGETGFSELGETTYVGL